LTDKIIEIETTNKVMVIQEILASDKEKLRNTL
jgi:hypothetical protein